MAGGGLDAGLGDELHGDWAGGAGAAGRKGVRSFFVIFLSGFNAMFIGLREVE